MEQKLLSLNYGQHILFGYLCSTIEGQTKMSLGKETLNKILTGIMELTAMDKYDFNHEQCPDVMIMMNPEISYEIFCDWYDENQEYFVNL